jgi:hypothetical protein
MGCKLFVYFHLFSFLVLVRCRPTTALQGAAPARQTAGGLAGDGIRHICAEPPGGFGQNQIRVAVVFCGDTASELALKSRRVATHSSHHGVR